jgi:hypothetical protein
MKISKQRNKPFKIKKKTKNDTLEMSLEILSNLINNYD